MTRNINLSKKIEKSLPPELVDLMRKSATIAARRNQALYLVGGVVRDLILGKPIFDIDLIVEGDAIGLATELAKETGGKLVTHTRFNTAKLKLEKWSFDLATARSETYEKPGALPAVKPGTLKEDLFRRDFTINAMAVRLSPGRWGELIDLYGGYTDLQNRLISVLHPQSFTDDATRIWRAIRYEQRLDFQIEPFTLSLLKRDVPMLDTISGDRIRHELELVLKEKQPEKILHRAWVLKALQRIHPALKGDKWLERNFYKARTGNLSTHRLTDLYYALFTFRLKESDVEVIIRFLRPHRQLTVILRETNRLKSHLKELEDSDTAPARIYSLLHGYTYITLLAALFVVDSPVAKKALEYYLNVLRYIKPALNGVDLQRLEVKQGPAMQEVLVLLHNARLNGEITSREEEEELVKRLLDKKYFDY